MNYKNKCNTYDTLKNQIKNLEWNNTKLYQVINKNQDDIEHLKDLLEQYKNDNNNHQTNLKESFWRDFKNKRVIIICEVKDVLEFLNLADNHGLRFMFHKEPWYKSLKLKPYIKNVALINNYDDTFKPCGRNVGQLFINQYKELGMDVIEFNPQNNLKISKFSDKELLDELNLRMGDR